MAVLYVKQCKVCNSKLRNLIEKLYVEASLSPEKIHEYLYTIASPEEQEIAKVDNFSTMAIRRHLSKHFDVKTGVKIRQAETITRLEQSKKDFKDGVDSQINTVAHLNHLIESNMLRLQEVEDTLEGKVKHEKIIQYTSTIKGLIESLAKLTGELKQEGNIDMNFFNDEISTFADIVLRSIRSIDFQLKLNGELEAAFATEFQNQWAAFNERRELIARGEMKSSDGNNMKNVNTFNEGM